ncbi:MAG: hypothetical protein AB8I08_29075 [Sandaracinaceae bacterium]
MLGACLYNRGRIAEERLEIEDARTFYDQSLEARPNATVRRRRGALGTRDSYTEEARHPGILGMLRRDDDNPCLGERCRMEVLAASRSGARRLLRTAVVAVYPRDEGEGEGVPTIYATWGGPTGTYHWGAMLYRPTREMTLSIDGWSVTAATRPLRWGEPWHLVVRHVEDWVERSYGGETARSNGFIYVCELDESDTRCVRIVERLTCHGGPDDPDDTEAYPSCDTDERNRITFDEGGVQITGEARGGYARANLRDLEPGRYRWEELFPEPAAPEASDDEGAAEDTEAAEPTAPAAE